MQLLLKRFVAAVQSVKSDVRPLFLPHLMRMAGMLSPGFHSICWSDPAWEDFYLNTLKAIKSFEVLVYRLTTFQKTRS
jgi:dynein heavy chain, axonemal